MTLRRSLAVTAVTALTSSAALFAAPVAFAAETPTASASPSASASVSASPSASASASVSTSASATADKKAETAAVTGTPTTAAAQPGVTTAAQPTNPGAAEQIPNPDKGNGPAVSFTGLPGDVVVGGKAVEITVNVKNATGKKLEFIPFVSLGNVATDTPLRASHIVLEAKLPGSDAWTKVEMIDTEADEAGATAAIGWLAAQDPEDPEAIIPLVLEKDEGLQIPVRLAFTANAPLGETIAFLAGVGFSNQESPDYFSASDFYVLNLVAPGTKGPANPDVRPVPPVKLPAKPKPSQNLAETGGSDSSAVTYAIVGGVALVGGAGLLVVMKRRRSGATPA